MKLYRVISRVTYDYVFNALAESAEDAVSQAYGNLSHPGSDETPKELGLTLEDLTPIEVTEAHSNE